MKTFAIVFQGETVEDAEPPLYTDDSQPGRTAC